MGMRKNKTLAALELRKLVEVFRRYPQVRAVYVFGSQASGRAGPESDLDLAIIPADRSLKAKSSIYSPNLPSWAIATWTSFSWTRTTWSWHMRQSGRTGSSTQGLASIGEAHIPGSSASSWISNPTCGSSAKRIRGGSSVLKPEVICQGTRCGEGRINEVGEVVEDGG